MKPNCASKWVIRKRGYFYRPNSQGYTGSVSEAGLYTEEEAKKHALIDGVTAHPLTEFIERPIYTFPASNVTADAVRTYREATGAGMHEAKNVLRKADYGRRMEAFKRDATLEAKIDFILDWIEKQETK
ncbi:hypothetical protein vBRpoSV10_168 [Ruegeria phage vB_RpoS-V10]|nr:hypothetical protein vBRpoSV10_168 [Ruegeria phage vB_RpoS-V10]